MNEHDLFNQQEIMFRCAISRKIMQFISETGWKKPSINRLPKCAIVSFSFDDGVCVEGKSVRQLRGIIGCDYRLVSPFNYAVQLSHSVGSIPCLVHNKIIGVRRICAYAPSEHMYPIVKGIL